jgi:hypothetical protein
MSGRVGRRGRKQVTLARTNDVRASQEWCGAMWQIAARFRTVVVVPGRGDGRGLGRGEVFVFADLLGRQAVGAVRLDDVDAAVDAHRHARAGDSDGVPVRGPADLVDRGRQRAADGQQEDRRGQPAANGLDGHTYGSRGGKRPALPTDIRMLWRLDDHREKLHGNRRWNLFGRIYAGNLKEISSYGRSRTAVNHGTVT